MDISKEKDLRIETLRGMAILLIVMGHVIGSAPDGGMLIDYPSPWRYFYLCSVFIRLPLITAIAGWVYTLKPVKWGIVGKFIKNKFFRLLIPMFVVATLYYVVQIIIPGTNKTENVEDIWKILIYPYNYFWYLYSLFGMMLCIAIIDANKWIDTFKGWIILLIISILLAAAESTIIPYNIPNFFGFKGTLKFFPFFVAGLGINRFSSKFSLKKNQKLYLILSIIGLFLLQIEWFFYFGNSPVLWESLKPIFIIPLLILLIYNMPVFKPLVWIGTFSYTIYLYHGFGTAGGRIILSYLGVHSHIIIFFVASIIAILCPVILDKILIKSRILRFLFLGKK